MTKTYSIRSTGQVYGFADSSHVSILVSGDSYDRGVRLFAEGVAIKDAERLVDLLNRHPDMEVLANLVDLGLDVKDIEMEEDGPEDVPESEASGSELRSWISNRSGRGRRPGTCNQARAEFL